MRLLYAGIAAPFVALLTAVILTRPTDDCYDIDVPALGGKQGELCTADDGTTYTK